MFRDVCVIVQPLAHHQLFTPGFQEFVVTEILGHTLVETSEAVGVQTTLCEREIPRGIAASGDQ